MMYSKRAEFYRNDDGRLCIRLRPLGGDWVTDDRFAKTGDLKRWPEESAPFGGVLQLEDQLDDQGAPAKVGWVDKIKALMS